MRKPSEIATAFSPRDSLDGKTKFFLVGIGGAGMSSLARMFQHRGFDVEGTDAREGSETVRLREEGIGVHIGHSGSALDSEHALVVSDAIDLEASPEISRARELGIPLVRRSQALGWLLQDYQVIAVTGTHGKTTTTGMLGAGLIAAGIDPLVVVGAAIPQWNSSVREGEGVWAVVEACEAYDSFHDLDPQIVLLTNLELDHIDYHGSYENLRDSVVRFVNKLPEDGWLVYCSEDRGASEVAELSDVHAMPYGASDDWIRLLSNKLGWSQVPNVSFGPTKPINLPGKHNVLNAAGALTVAAMIGADLELVGADLEKVEKGVREFGGAERRLQVLQRGSVTVIDDYAHHPTEIAASLTALRDRFFREKKGEGRLIVVFQPHLYSRTESMIDEFAGALDNADLVVLTDIYPAREDPIPGVSSARVAERLKKPVLYVPSRYLLPSKVASIVRTGDVVVGMGAGNISEFAPAFIHELERLSPDRKQLNISVLYGGESAEREVSLHSGRAIHAALERLGHHSRLVDMTELLFAKGNLSAFIGPDRPDLAFLAVHGTGGEDGAMQGLLEMLHIPYTGSGIQASAIGMDKATTKKLLAQAGVRTPNGVLLHHPSDPVELTGPLIVKPNAQGSTVGLAFVEDPKDLRAAIEKAFAYDESVLVEEWIRGMEISTPVLCGEALAPVEIAPASGRYDFASKYLIGATEEIIPARLPAEVLAEAQRLALLAHRGLGCKGASRTDAIVRDGELFVLEVNTLPGMTPTSLLPNSAKAVGISFDEVCDRLIKDALRSYAEKA